MIDSAEQVVDIAPLADTPVCSLDFTDQISDDNRRRVIFVCELWQGEQRLVCCTATFAPNKHLELVDPGLMVEMRQEGDVLVFGVTAQSLARFVELRLEGTNAVFSDNYFDIPAADKVRITCKLPASMTLDQTRAALRVRSLYDSYTELTS